MAPSSGIMPPIQLVGVGKAGSSSLWAYFSRHRICGADDLETTPPHYGRIKELPFWYNFDGHRQTIPTPAGYLHMFSNRSGDCVGWVDANPSRLMSSLVPAKLMEFAHAAGSHAVASVRIIATVREPIGQHLSWYNHRVDANAQRTTTCAWGFGGPGKAGGAGEHFCLSYSQLIDREFRLLPRCAVAHRDPADLACMDRHQSANGYAEGLAVPIYVTQLRRYKQAWPRKQILIVQFEQLVAEQDDGLSRIGRFIGMQFAERRFPHSNEHSGPCKLHQSDVPCETLHRMQDLFRPYNAALFADLADEHEQGRVPPEERIFEPWLEEHVSPCSSKVLRPVNLSACAHPAPAAPGGAPMVWDFSSLLGWVPPSAAAAAAASPPTPPSPPPRPWPPIAPPPIAPPPPLSMTLLLAYCGATLALVAVFLTGRSCGLRTAATEGLSALRRKRGQLTVRLDHVGSRIGSGLGSRPRTKRLKADEVRRMVYEMAEARLRAGHGTGTPTASATARPSDDLAAVRANGAVCRVASAVLE
jgi:hypothetical protein